MTKRSSKPALGGATVAFLVLGALLIALGIGQAHPGHPIFTRPAHSAVYHRPPAHVRTV